MDRERRFSINADSDVVTARSEGRSFASQLDFSSTELTLIATAISEVARNIITYARRGEVAITLVEDGGREGIMVVATDDGPGIADISMAMQDGFSTHRGLGLGLPGTRRLMDEFEISSTPGNGTTIRMAKWTMRRA